MDADPLELTSLEEDDVRSVSLRVAGPGALLLAKLHKIEDRLGTKRTSDKDALDILRLLRGVPTEELARRFEVLRRDPRSAKTSSRGVELLGRLFGSRAAPGSAMAAQAVGTLANAEETALSCELLAQDLLAVIKP